MAKISELKIRKDNGMWYVRVDGKVKYFSSRLTREEAEQERAKLVLKLADNFHTNTNGKPWDGITLDKLIPLYIEDQKEVWYKTTADAMKHQFAEIVRSLGSYTPTTLTDDDVKRWMSNPAWNPSTKNKRLSTLKAFFADCVAKKKVSTDPTATVKVPSALVRGEEHVIYADEWAKLQLHLEPLALKVCTLLWLVGARPTEALTAHADEYYPTAMELRPKHHKNKRKGKSRTILLDDEANAIVAEAYKQSPNGYLFKGVRGRPWNASMLAQAVADARRMCQLRDKITPYSMRHAYICRKILAGVPISILAAWVGNSVPTCERHYTHTIERAKDTRRFMSLPDVPFTR